MGEGTSCRAGTTGGSSELAAFASDPSLIVYEATEPGDVARIRREVEGRRWATAQGIPTAETVAVGPDEGWMVSRRLVDEPGESRAYLEAALDMALRLQRTPVPDFATPGATWATPRSAKVANALQLAAAGVSPREFVATRAAAEQLPRTSTVHNDYHRGNVLNQTEQGRVAVVDWEYTSVGPTHHDFLRLLVDVRDDELAQQGWRMLCDLVPGTQQTALRQQFRWLALRTYGSEVCARPERDRAKCVRRRHRWLDVKEWTS